MNYRFFSTALCLAPLTVVIGFPSTLFALITLAVPWFGIGYAAGVIYYYPFVLLVLGMISVIKGVLEG